ncbi:hypothetical protein LTR74_018385 [Friedmanniomyces endolithicus]|nr:hypothetical protein LTR74_018385 [Friedmanniomyces endolithicus]
MANIGARSTAGDVKAATGFNATEWKYFQKITRELLEAVFDLDCPNDNDFRQGVEEFATGLRLRCKGIIASWDDVSPQEVRRALDLVNAELAREGIKGISHDVFRWRMLQTVRYLKRQLRRGTPTKAEEHKAASTDHPVLESERKVGSSASAELLRQADIDEEQIIP